MRALAAHSGQLLIIEKAVNEFGITGSMMADPRISTVVLARIEALHPQVGAAATRGQPRRATPTGSLTQRSP